MFFKRSQKWLSGLQSYGRLSDCGFEEKEVLFSMVNLFSALLFLVVSLCLALFADDCDDCERPLKFSMPNLFSVLFFIVVSFYLAFFVDIGDDFKPWFVLIVMGALYLLSYVFDSRVVRFVIIFVFLMFVNVVLHKNDVYGWVASFSIGAIACMHLFFGIFEMRKNKLDEKREIRERLERRKRLEKHGKEIIGIITNTVETGYIKSPTRCSYDLRLTVEATPPGGKPFSRDVLAGAEFYDLPKFRPGTKVKIRYLPDDPKAARFINVVNNARVFVQKAHQPKPVVCSFCQTHFDLSENTVCPNCRAPYVN